MIELTTEQLKLLLESTLYDGDGYEIVITKEAIENVINQNRIKNKKRKNELRKQKLTNISSKNN